MKEAVWSGAPEGAPCANMSAVSNKNLGTYFISYYLRRNPGCRWLLALSPGKDGAAIHVENLPGDETCPGGAQEQNGSGNLIRSTYAPERDCAQHFLRLFGVVQG